MPTTKEDQVNTPVIEKYHVFDRRDEPVLIEVKAKRSKQPVLCLRCKLYVNDPNSICKGKDRPNEHE